MPETSQSASPTPGRRQRSALGSLACSGRLTPILVGILCLVLLAATWEYGRGHLHKVTAVLDNAPTPTVSAGPGGQSVLRLVRPTSASSGEPEFASITLLPGRGFNVFQITARLPGRGEVPLLDSPSVTSAESLLTGNGPDSNGSASTTMGGAFLLPWARRLTGVPVTTSQAVPLLSSSWQGRTISFPPDGPASSRSTQGLLLMRASDALQTAQLPDGQSALATYRVGDFDSHWPAPVTITVLAELHAQTIDLTVSAHNDGSVAVPLGIGWQPHFAPPSGDRSDALLTVPSTTAVEVNRAADLPTGRVSSVAETPLDFSRATGTGMGPGAVVGTGPLDETYLNLQHGAGTAGPTAELADPASGLRLRLTALTPNITSFHVRAPEGDTWISIAPNTNVDDPLGPEWAGAAPGGLLTLAPGQTIQWKVRLTISSLNATSLP